MSRSRLRRLLGRARCRRGFRRCGRWAAHPDEGSAVVEFVTLGVLLLLPVMYLVVTLGRLQAAAYATDGGARAAARAFAGATDPARGEALADAAVRLALADQGLAADSRGLRLSCTSRPCLAPGSRVTVQVSVDVVLPFVPGFVDDVVPTHVTVRSTQVAAVDAFRAAGP